MEQRKDIMTGIIRISTMFIVGSIFLAIAGYILSFVIDIIGRIIVFVLQWAVFGGIAWYGYKYFKKPKPKEKPAEVIPEEAIRLYTSSGQPIVIGNPFRGIFVLGAAGSGKSESIAVPLLSEFIRNGFSGLVYDFKFPTLGPRCPRQRLVAEVSSLSRGGKPARCGIPHVPAGYRQTRNTRCCPPPR
jgi:hypothetical protein